LLLAGNADGVAIKQAIGKLSGPADLLERIRGGGSAKLSIGFDTVR
jgi:hypothetical protein